MLKYVYFAWKSLETTGDHFKISICMHRILHSRSGSLLSSATGHFVHQSCASFPCIIRVHRSRAERGSYPVSVHGVCALVAARPPHKYCFFETSKICGSQQTLNAPLPAKGLHSESNAKWRASEYSTARLLASASNSSLVKHRTTAEQAIHFQLKMWILLISLSRLPFEWKCPRCLRCPETKRGEKESFWKEKVILLSDSFLRSEWTVKTKSLIC